MERTPAINLPPAVLWLSVALIAIHVARQFIAPGLDDRILVTFSFIPARYGDVGPLMPGGVAARYWTPVTYAFLHANAVHLIVNVVWMASFGTALARRFGTGRFLLISLLATIAGAAIHYLAHAGEQGLVIGASGAVSGMMAGTARFAFSPGGPLGAGAVNAATSYRVPAEPLMAAARNPRAVAFIVIWFAVNLIFGLGGGLVAGVPGQIAWEAHIGGFLAGLLAFPLLDPVRGADAPREE